MRESKQIWELWRSVVVTIGSLEFDEQTSAWSRGVASPLGPGLRQTFEVLATSANDWCVKLTESVALRKRQIQRKSEVGRELLVVFIRMIVRLANPCPRKHC